MKEILKLVKEIEEHIHICCMASMDQDEVLILIDKLKEKIKNYPN